MPARPREEAPGAVHHVTARGANRSRICRDDADYRALTRFLAIACQRHEWVCLAYCLMENHMHLVVETPRPNLGVGMQFLLAAYARRHHHRHLSSGQPFQGRYHALSVNRDAYLLEVVRYVLLNPVRAGLCRKAQQWRWSSAQDALGLRASPSWVDPGLVFELLGPTDGRGAERLERFLEEGPGSTLAHNRRQSGI
jgi:REP element-mobilizing transposase RayT